MNREQILGWCDRELAYWSTGYCGSRAFDREFDRLNAEYFTLFVVDVRNGKVTVLPKADVVDAEGVILGESQPAVRMRLYQSFIADAVSRFAPDLQVRIALDVHDVPLARGRAPIFSFQKTAASHNILLPDVDFMQHDWYSASTPAADHQGKTLSAIFAGSSTGGGILTSDDVHHNRCERLRLAHDFDNNPKVTFKIAHVAQCADGDAEALLRAKPFFSNEISWSDQLSHQFMLSVDGNGATCSRVVNTLRSHSTLVKLVSPNLLYYFQGMAPWVHYIPVESVEDVDRVIADAEFGSLDFEQISRNGRDFFADFLAKDAVHFYMAELLTRYASIALTPHFDGRPGAAAENHPIITEIRAHFANVGDTSVRGDEPIDGGGNAMEGFQLASHPEVPKASLRYRSRSKDGLWGVWSNLDEFSGSQGEGKPLLGIELELGEAMRNDWHLECEIGFAKGGVCSIIGSSGRCECSEGNWVTSLSVRLLPAAPPETYQP